MSGPIFLEFQILCLETGLTLTGLSLCICGKAPRLASLAATDACRTCGCRQPVALRLERPDDGDGRGNGYGAEDIALGAILNCSCPCTNITVSHTQNQLMPSYIINTASLRHVSALKRPYSGNKLIHFNGKVKGQIKIQLITQGENTLQ